MLPASIYGTYSHSVLAPLGVPIAAGPAGVNLAGPVTVADCVATEVAVNVTAAAADAVVRFGIYQAAATGKPGILLWDSGDVPADTTGVKSVAVGGAGLPLAGNLWTVMASSDGAVKVMGWDPLYAEHAAGTAGGNARATTNNAATGAPLPEPLTISGSNSSNGRAAALLIKVAD